jgi:hypothetical protein
VVLVPLGGGCVRVKKPDPSDRFLIALGAIALAARYGLPLFSGLRVPLVVPDWPEVEQRALEAVA